MSLLSCWRRVRRQLLDYTKGTYKKDEERLFTRPKNGKGGGQRERELGHRSVAFMCYKASGICTLFCIPQLAERQSKKKVKKHYFDKSRGAKSIDALDLCHNLIPGATCPCVSYQHYSTIQFLLAETSFIWAQSQELSGITPV
ncbi:hypothetical protein WISP_90590 [Willisornis vidua]|uniref:Uncharacterized protein n=1 Tax=Willisornis vidua TaxID=1566151 RepID=A0ABQ9D1J1_9PASS|nr:hypothetical protein WISP_90590 [Willisornis vidua]